MQRTHSAAHALKHDVGPTVSSCLRISAAQSNAKRTGNPDATVELLVDEGND